MNCLLQLYACDPYQGGEFAVSWGWLMHLEKQLAEKDKIYVCSATLKQEDIDRHRLKHVQLITIQTDNIKYAVKIPQLYYFLWLWEAWKAAKSLTVDFDIIHVFSLSDFRMPGYFYKFTKAFTILGPVGGGQVCPFSLISYDRKWLFRYMINMACRINPIYRFQINKYNKVFVVNKETKSYIKNSEILIDVPLNDKFKKIEIRNNTDNNDCKILFCGRLINKKGVLFFLDVVKEMPKDLNFQVNIFGDGEQREKIQNKIHRYGLDGKVKLRGKVPYDQISDAYRESDIFVFPSLRESGGNVLIEAMAHSLPVISLDMSFSSELKKQNTGIFINIKQSKKKIIRDFQYALEMLVKDKDLRKRLGRNGYRFVNDNLTWDKMVEKVYGGGSSLNKVAVIILNYNTWERTLLEIDNIQKVVDYNYDIIVVDNCSSNHSYHELKKRSESKKFNLLQSKKNGGYASGNNIGLRYAFRKGFRYAWVLNNDIEIKDTEILKKMVKVLKTDSKLAVVNPDIYSPDGYMFNRDSVRPAFYDFTIGALQYKKKGRKLKDRGGWGYIYRPQGCCMLVDLKKMEEIDYFDENTFLYCEEPILAEKLLGKGYRCACCISTNVIHNHSYTVRKALSRISYIRCNLKSFAYLLKEYRGFGCFQINICCVFQLLRMLLTNQI